MTPYTLPPPLKEALITLNAITATHRLSLKALTVQTRAALIFLILNDTIQALSYDRALLWDIDRPTPLLLGTSGHTETNTTTALAHQWLHLVKDIAWLPTQQVLSNKDFKRAKDKWHAYASSDLHPSVLWLPLAGQEKPYLGLWLEKWDKPEWSPKELETAHLLAQIYGLAWKRFKPRLSYRFKRVLYRLIPLILVASLFLIRLPLRLSAPCEIVPQDPLVVTAPLEGIIDHINVKPDQEVQPGDLLVSYDKREAMQNLKIAQENLKVAQLDLTRSKTLAFKDQESLAEIAVLEAKSTREAANLALARYKVDQLEIKSPITGHVMLNNPDEWRGRPVKVGEKILTVINPRRTKVRLWIPADETMPIDLKRPVKIFLNSTPTINRLAQFTFISHASTVTESHLVAFMAEADWLQKQSDIAPGLKGTALIYGENVSLFYWLFHKPWIALRDWMGI